MHGQLQSEQHTGDKMNLLFDCGIFDTNWLGDVTGYMTTYNSHWYDQGISPAIPREVWQVRHEHGVE
jgi:hypothetical protein